MCLKFRDHGFPLFRLDFSLNRGLSVDEEVDAVQGRTNSSAIQQGLPVQCQVVPLSAAMKINGVRAMFGETYPDPVRCDLFV